MTALKADNLSAGAVNAYLTAIKSFSPWLKRDGRTSDYALETLAELNEQADRRRIRRALSPEEAAKVIKAAETGPEAGGLAAPDCQTLARHSTPTLTIGLYAKVSLHDIKGAVENLPDLTPRESSPEPLAMTGTDPVVTPISERLSHHFPTGEDGTIRNRSDAGVMMGSTLESTMDRNSLEISGLDASGQDRSDAGGNAPRRTRTYNPLIKSQLLCQLS